MLTNFYESENHINHDNDGDNNNNDDDDNDVDNNDDDDNDGDNNDKRFHRIFYLKHILWFELENILVELNDPQTQI